METHKEKTSSNAGRRIRWLAAAIVGAVVLYTAGWFWFAGQIDAATGIAFEEQASQGVEIDCVDRDVRGYPFRFEMHCTQVRVVQPGSDFTLAANAFRSAAQVYEPSRIVAELDGPLHIEAGGLPVTLRWSLARGSTEIAEPLPKRASIEFDGLNATIGTIENALSANRAEAHMRSNGPDLDLAMRYEGLIADAALTGARDLPALGGDADLTIKNGVALASDGASSLRGVKGDIRRIALQITPDQGVIISGPFAVGAGGLINASLNLTIVDPAGLAAAFKPAFPDYAAQIETLAAAAPKGEAGKTPEISLPLSIRDGRAVIGFIPLGEIPPLN